MKKLPSLSSLFRPLETPRLLSILKCLAAISPCTTMLLETELYDDSKKNQYRHQLLLKQSVFVGLVDSSYFCIQYQKSLLLCNYSLLMYLFVFLVDG